MKKIIKALALSDLHLGELETLLYNSQDEHNLINITIDKISELSQGNKTFDSGVEESSIAPFWHILHETFVEMVSALRSLILSSYLVAAEPSGREIVLRGWFRDKSQYDLDYKSSEDEMLVFLKLGSIQKLLLYPFIIIREHNVFIFDHLRTKDRAISFLDYRSGECRQFPFSDIPEIDLYEVWNRKNQWLGAKFKIQNKKVRKEADK